MAHTHTAALMETNEARYNPPLILWRAIVVFAVVLVCIRISSSFGPVIGGLLAIYALRGPRQSLEALTILAFLLIHGSSEMSVARWIVLLAAFGRMLWDTVILGGTFPRIVRPLFVLTISVALLSFLASQYVVVSLFKLISFTVGITTLLACFHRTSEFREYWFSWFTSFSLFILIVSIPFIGTAAGYARGAGFQGVLSHPQTYGPVAAVMGAFITGQILFHGDRRWYMLLGAAAAWIGVYMSEARTALLAVLLALIVASALSVVGNSAWRYALRRVAVRPTSIAMFLVVLFILGAQWERIQEGMTAFLLKDTQQATSVAESLQESRMGLIMASLDNFKEHPITGIGFGVPTNDRYFKQETGVFGIPVKASVEKGFMPSAVLEEIGMPGALLTLWLIVSLIVPAIRHPDITLFWVVGTCLLVNLGEMVFFSIGGMGLYFWMMMAFVHMYALQTSESSYLPAVRMQT